MKRSRRWISTTLSLCLVGLGFGCREASEEVVWVDVRHAAAVLATAESSDWPTPAPDLPAIPAERVTLPGFGGAMIDRAMVAARRAEAQRILADQLAETQQLLEEAYRVQLRATARALASDLRESLRERISEGHEESLSAIERIIEASAEERGPKVVRLALLVGWPDDGRSDFIRFADQSGPVEESWNAEADRLRAELRAHDAVVARQLEAVLAGFDDVIAAERASNEQRVQDELRKADEAAAQRARLRFQETAKLTLPRLLVGERSFAESREATTLDVPGVGGTAVNVPVPETLAPAVQTLRSRLDIWLAVHGYKLAEGPEHAPDYTGDFIAWIRQP